MNPHYKLKDLIVVHYGEALKSNERVGTGPFNVYGSNGCIGKHSHAVVQRPTIIIGRKGSVGAINYAPEGGWPIDTCFYVEVIKSSILDLRYLYYALIQARFAEHIITTSIPGLSRDAIYRTSITLPPLSEQRRIAAILDKADAVRRKRKEAIKLTEFFLRSVFIDMFGDPVTNSKGWLKVPLEKLIVLKSGDFLPSKSMDSKGNYPVYGGNGKTGIHGSYMFEEQVVIIGRVGVYCGVVHLTDLKSWITDNALYVAKHDDRLELCYLEWALRMANLNQYASQAAQPLISGGRLYPIEIMLPHKDMQIQFGKLIGQYQTMESRYKEASSETSALFEVLLRGAFQKDL